jgi:hypothetical protein
MTRTDLMYPLISFMLLLPLAMLDGRLEGLHAHQAEIWDGMRNLRSLWARNRRLEAELEDLRRGNVLLRAKLKWRQA